MTSFVLGEDISPHLGKLNKDHLHDDTPEEVGEKICCLFVIWMKQPLNANYIAFKSVSERKLGAGALKTEDEALEAEHRKTASFLFCLP